MTNSSKSNLNSEGFNQKSYSVFIHHRDKIRAVDYFDFSSKSSFKEAIGLPHSFNIKIDDTLQIDSVDALIEHINTREIDKIINSSNVFDLNFLAYIYGFYLLQAATGPFILSQVPINRVFEAFESRRSIEGYVQSFSYYFTHNFNTFVRDPSFYSLPLSIIENMIDKNASKLTADDVIQFTINTYYSHGKKALVLLEKADKCKNSISNDRQRNQSDKEVYKQLQNSKSPLRNVFFHMIDSDENENSNRKDFCDTTDGKSNIDSTIIDGINNNSNLVNNPVLNKDSRKLINIDDNNNDNNNNTNYTHDDRFKESCNNANTNSIFSNNDKDFHLNNYFNENENDSNSIKKDYSNDSDSFHSTLKNHNFNNIRAFDGYYQKYSSIKKFDNTENFSVNYNEYSENVKPIIKKVKRGGRILEKESSTASLIHLYATIAHERPYPYTQYICQIISQRKKTIESNTKVKQIEELRYDISSLYIALLETTQGNKSAAYILLTSLYETGKIDFMTDKEIYNLYRNLSDIPPEKVSTKTSSSLFSSCSSEISLSFSDFDQFTTDVDQRLLQDDFDWGAHGLYMMYRIYQDGLFGCPKDPRKAQNFLKMSVDRGYKDAYFKLASFIVSSGDFLTIKEDKLNILQKAADFGNGDFQFAYASNLAERRDKMLNVIRSVHYFKLAILSGHPNAEKYFNTLQCSNCRLTQSECVKHFTRILNEKIIMSHKLFQLKMIADCGFQLALFAYPDILSKEDCSPLNADRPMGLKMQRRDVITYFKKAMKINIKKCHCALSLFLLKSSQKVEDIKEAMDILAEGSALHNNDATLLLGRLLLRLLGPSYRKPQKAIDLFSPLVSSNYIPALLELSLYFLYDRQDISFAMSFLNQLHELKEPIGSSLLLYNSINLPSTPKQQQALQIAELKAFADSYFSEQPPQGSQILNEIEKVHKNLFDDLNMLPVWLYAKVLLEGRSSSTDFKTAISYLNRAVNCVPAQVLLTSLSFQYSHIVKANISKKIIGLLNMKFNNAANTSLPSPSATISVIKKFASQNDPTFRYKLGSILLDEDEDSEVAFEHIRQSAFGGSICGMMKYGFLRLDDRFRPKNELEALEMFKKAGLLGLDLGLIFYARYAMKYSELKGECLSMLRSIRTTLTVAPNLNYVTGKKSECFDSNKLKLAFGGCLSEFGNASLEESEYHLTSLINEYHQQQLQEENGLSDGLIEFKISQADFAEALYHYGKTLIKRAVFSGISLETSRDAVTALNMLQKSYANGYKPAAEAYFSLLFNMKRTDAAIDFLLDNLSVLTFALYKIGSLSLFESKMIGVITCVSETQAIDFLKLATLAEDASLFPDALWKFGTMLRDGLHVAKDEKSSLDHFLRAAENGSIPAVVAVGNIALKMTTKNVPLDNSTFSMVSQNKTVAYKCFTNASLSGSCEGSWCRALCLIHGVGCRRNVYEAVRVLKSLADRADRDALYRLGKIVFNASKSKDGKVSFPLYDLGIRLILNAANLGHSTAIWRIGLFILQGQIDKNLAANILINENKNFFNESTEKVAASLFIKSASYGNRRGAQLLSLCYENGIGVDHDLKLARFYASFNGNGQTK